jgi:hypothetical protein
MGFDIYGKNAKSEKGEYFRNNVWWWHRLADLVIDHWKEIGLKEKEIQDWHSNSGQKVSKESAEKISKWLNKVLKDKDDKDARKWETWIEQNALEHKKMELAIKKSLDEKCKDTLETIKSNYPFHWSNVKDFAEFCEASGGFEIW